MAIKIEYLDNLEDVYDIEVEDNHNFYANGILVHNCTEVTLPTRPLTSLTDPDGMIALCILGANNYGKIRKPSDFEKPCTLLVRVLDAIIDEQSYPVLAAENATRKYRPLGIGIINYAYWMVKNDTNYINPDLDLMHEYAEAWSYYLIKASADLAEEFGPCPGWKDTKYGQGILPIDTYKKDVDELVKPVYRYDWEQLRERLRITGIRNSTLMASMPSETSSQISNSTNALLPPRDLVSVKQSKDGVLKQVVPGIQKYKNKYNLLWELKSPEEYLKIIAVNQKFMDQALSVDTFYNPINYEGNEIPESVLMQHILLTYKLGIKTLYYNNINDGAGEEVVDEEELCEGCTI